MKVHKYIRQIIYSVGRNIAPDQIVKHALVQGVRARQKETNMDSAFLEGKFPHYSRNDSAMKQALQKL